MESSSRASGVTLLSGAYSGPSTKPFWTVTIHAPAPTSQPRQNTLCTGPNDIVLFTLMFGALPPPAPSSGPAVQAVLNAHGLVVLLGTPGGTLPVGDSAVQAIGTDAAWLSDHAQVGQRLIVSEQLRTAWGVPFPPNPEMSIASAGPILLPDGRADIEAVNEGVRDPNNYTFSAYRHARTLVGVDGRGRLLLATTDGVPGVNAGLTLTEEADLMRSLGAVDAMNLDGGGSHGDAFAPLCPYRGSLVQTVPRVLLSAGGEGARAARRASQAVHEEAGVDDAARSRASTMPEITAGGGLLTPTRDWSDRGGVNGVASVPTVGRNRRSREGFSPRLLGDRPLRSGSDRPLLDQGSAEDGLTEASWALRHQAQRWD